MPAQAGIHAASCARDIIEERTRAETCRGFPPPQE